MSSLLRSRTFVPCVFLVIIGLGCSRSDDGAFQVRQGAGPAVIVVDNETDVVEIKQNFREPFDIRLVEPVNGASFGIGEAITCVVDVYRNNPEISLPVSLGVNLLQGETGYDYASINIHSDDNTPGETMADGALRYKAILERPPERPGNYIIFADATTVIYFREEIKGRDIDSVTQMIKSPIVEVSIREGDQ
ncbi:hypothetical protein [Tautonia rosea]|uniref:hypothetical protein n=1 Tax=Tautonia rosea TaxID=2728037 RepID=UPI001472C2B7|nr:hypothetical protein [Tautonia rosea]